MSKSKHENRICKMLFVLPPSQKEGQRFSPSHHPIMTATLAGVARTNGAEVQVIDAVVTGQSYSEIVETILSFQPDWIGIMPFEYRREMEISSIIQFASYLRNSMPAATIGLLNCPLHDNPCKDALGIVDFIYWGDSEEAVQHFVINQNFEISGVSYVDQTGLHEHSVKNMNWSILCTPAWDLFDVFAYVPSAHRYLKRPVLPVMTTRSCPFGCDFCPHSLFHTSDEYMIRPATDVLREIQELHQKYHIANIEFYDPTFGINKDHTLEICRGLRQMQQTGISIGWSCYSRCDLLSKDLLQEMKQSGCHTILFGVESGNSDVLARTKKQLQLSEVQQFVQNCHEIGIQTIASFILGLPLDTPNTIRQTINFACSLNPTFAQFHPARIFFAHDDWKELGDFEQKWDETSSSINGISYIPKQLTKGGIYWYLLRSYLQFYGRPSKISQMVKQLDSKEDVQRYVLGLKQIIFHMRDLQKNNGS